MFDWFVSQEIAGVAKAIVFLFQDDHHHRVMMVVVELVFPDERLPESLDLGHPL